jgi:hypothetical protein
MGTRERLVSICASSVKSKKQRKKEGYSEICLGDCNSVSYLDKL